VSNPKEWKVPKSPSLSAKTAPISVRLSPKFKFALNLMSRLQHRPVSAVIEELIRRAMGDEKSELYVVVRSKGREEERQSILDQVWDPEEPDRFAKVAMKYPRLLTHEEEIAWKRITEDAHLWESPSKLNFAAFRREWGSLSKRFSLEI
jgi:hypothetical protein